MTERPDDLAPETVNNEQEEAETQAQSVAEDARTRSVSILTPEKSKKLSNSLNPAEEPDLVERMEQMNTSGTIDMDAYAGEETHDDLENKYGREDAADPDFADDDS